MKTCTSIAPLSHVGLSWGRGRPQDNTGGRALPWLSELEDRDAPTRPARREASASRKVRKRGSRRGGEALRRHGRSLVAPGKLMVPEGFQSWRQAPWLGHVAGQRIHSSWREEVGRAMTPSPPRADGGAVTQPAPCCAWTPPQPMLWLTCPGSAAPAPPWGPRSRCLACPHGRTWRNSAPTGTPCIRISAPRAPLFRPEKSSLFFFFLFLLVLGGKTLGNSKEKREREDYHSPNAPTNGTWAQQGNWTALVKHRAHTKKENVQRVVQKMRYNERRKHLSKWLTVTLSWFVCVCVCLLDACNHSVCADTALPQVNKPLHLLLMLLYKWAMLIQWGGRRGGHRNIMLFDGSPPLSLTVMNFLVHLQEVGITSQNLTFKQHRTPTSVLLTGSSYTAFPYKE